MSDKPNYSIETSFENHENAAYFEVGKPVRGKLIVKANEDLPILQFGYELMMELKGRTSTQKYKIAQGKILDKFTFKAGSIYEYPIEFTNTQYATYEGRNASLVASFKPIVKEETSGVGKIKNRIKDLFSDPSRSPGHRYLKFQFPYTKLDIIDEFIRFKRISDRLLIWILILLIGPWMIFLFWDIGPKIIAIISLISAITLSTYYLLETQLVGRLTAEFIESEKEEFDFILRNEKNWKYIRDIKVNFRVIEEVIDNRGTSDSTYEKVIYLSGRYHKKNPTEAVHATFQYPDVKYASFTLGNLSLNWQLVTKVTLNLGISYTYKQYFEVKGI